MNDYTEIGEVTREEYRRALYNFPCYRDGVPPPMRIFEIAGVGENIRRTLIDPAAKWPEPEEIQEPKRWKSDIDKSTLDELKAGVANCWDSFRQRY